VDSIADLAKQFVRLVGEIEGGTWGGRADLAFLAIVIVVAFLFSPFRFVAQLITAIVARKLGVPPARFLPQPGSRVKDALLLLALWVVSIFTVWFTRL
jgi:hypothetical protein